MDYSVLQVDKKYPIKVDFPVRIGSQINRTGLKTSPWLIIGAAAILLAIVLVGAIQNTRRDRRHMTQVLTAKGAALIRGVEAGARTGMMGFRWGGDEVQRLLEETAQLPDVQYMAVIDKDGTILAHSDPERVGQAFRADRQLTHPGPDYQEDWEIVDLEDGARVFEIHRIFKPLPPNWHRLKRQGGHMMRWHMSTENDDRKDWFKPDDRSSQIIIAGLDMSVFEESMAGDVRQTILISVILILLGFAGIVSLFWMQSYRAARKSLQDTSTVADNVVAHLPVGLIATDKTGRIAFFNGAAARMTGISQQEALGRTPETLLPDQLCGLQAFLDDGRTIVEKEMECRLDGHNRVPVSVSAARIVNEENQVLGHVLILRDLGEVRRLQDEIRRQEKLAALGGLAAGVAHEIRNPLSSIKGLATYFAGKFVEGSEDRHVAQVMTQEVDRLNRVISELLEFARPTDVKPHAVDVNELIRHSLKLVQQDTAAKGIEVVQQLDHHLCRAEIDPDRVSQCLLNLYLNAFDAMPEGGRMTVSSAMDEDQKILIAVTDTGGGIEAADMEKVFNPYFTTKPKGTGLGLPIIHKIIEAHGGRVQVDSTPGRGTRFELILPCQSKKK
jgi:two-component system sensor histidine kinase HydH